jgi:hypothetical protein
VANLMIQTDQYKAHACQSAEFEQGYISELKRIHGRCHHMLQDAKRKSKRILTYIGDELGKKDQYVSI